MNSYSWVSIISLCGWLILALGSYQAYRVSAKKTLILALAWAAIFMLVAFVFSAFG